MNADELRNWREGRAKEVYGIYQHRTGETTPWELLNARHRAAWLEVERALNDEPECNSCGNVLQCAECDDIGPDCPFCGADMVCPACDYAEKTDATDEAKKDDKTTKS